MTKKKNKEKKQGLAYLIFMEFLQAERADKKRTDLVQNLPPRAQCDGCLHGRTKEIGFYESERWQSKFPEPKCRQMHE